MKEGPRANREKDGQREYSGLWCITSNVIHPLCLFQAIQQRLKQLFNSFLDVGLSFKCKTETDYKADWFSLSYNFFWQVFVENLLWWASGWDLDGPKGAVGASATLRQTM